MMVGRGVCRVDVVRLHQQGVHERVAGGVAIVGRSISISICALAVVTRLFAVSISVCRHTSEAFFSNVVSA